MTKPSLSLLFDPEAIAVVGVSENPSKLGSVIYNNVLTTGFRGKLYPVNPKYKELYEEKCYKSVSAIPGRVDIAVIVVPAEFVKEVIRDCGKKQVKYAVIITAGFRELGEKGGKLEDEIKAVAEEHDVQIVGPNCLGIISPGTHLNASFAAHNPKLGRIAFASQSGAVNTAILDMAAEVDLGFSYFVSMGNKAGLTELDFLKYWFDDPAVDVIGLYLESFVDGNDLVELIKSHPQKPVVILHPGESNEAQAAIASHTGSLAGSSTVIRTALHQAGAIQVDTFEKLFWTMLALGETPNLPLGNKVAIVTNAGGPGILLTDMLIKNDLKLAVFSDETKQALSKSLPVAANIHNPVDVVGDAQADRYAFALSTVLKDQEVDSIIVLLTPQIVTQIEETAKVIIDISKVSTKPILPVFLGGKYVQPGLQRMYDSHLAAFSQPEFAVYALQQLVAYAKFRSREVEPKLKLARHAKYTDEVEGYVADKPITLPQAIVEMLAKEVELDLPKQQLVYNLQDADEFARKINFPVVLKAASEDVVHKTDVKALYLNIQDHLGLARAFGELQANIHQLSGKAQPAILIQEQVHGGEELIIGANRDGHSDVYQKEGKGFGHLLVFGKGGIYTEVYKDVASGLVPLSRTEMLAMVNQTKVSQVIHGIRGKSPLALEALMRTLQAVQELVELYPQIVSLDINPAILNTDRCVIVDMKVFVQK